MFDRISPRLQSGPLFLVREPASKAADARTVKEAMLARRIASAKRLNDRIARCTFGIEHTTSRLLLTLCTLFALRRFGGWGISYVSVALDSRSTGTKSKGERHRSNILQLVAALRQLPVQK